MMDDEINKAIRKIALKGAEEVKSLCSYGCGDPLPNFFIDCQGNPETDSELRRQLKFYEDAEDYEYCEEIKTELERRQTVKTNA